MAHHAEAGIKALLGIGVTGGDRSNLGDARIVIDTRRRNAGPGVPVTDHPCHFAVDQALGHGHGGTRVRLIVLGLQLKGHRFAANRRVSFIHVVDGKLRAVLQILTDTRRRTGQRASQTDNYGLIGMGWVYRCSAEGGEGDHGAQHFMFHGFHYCFPDVGGVLNGNFA